MVRGQWANLSRMPGLHPYSFSKDILGFFMTTESQDLGLMSHPKVGPLCVLTVLAQKITWFRNDALFNRLFSVHGSDVRSEKKHQDSA